MKKKRILTATLLAAAIGVFFALSPLDQRADNSSKPAKPDVRHPIENAGAYEATELSTHSNDTEPATPNRHRLDPQGQLRVRVIDAEGKPVPGVAVYPRQRGGTPDLVGAKQTNAVGEVSVDGLHPGEYSLYLSHDRYDSSRTELRLAEGQETATVVLYRDTRLFVRVIGSDGELLHNVDFRDTSRGIDLYGQLDGDCHTVTNLNWGADFDLEIEADAYLGVILPQKAVQRGEARDLGVVQLSPGEVLALTVVDADGVPVENIRVCPERNGAPRFTDTSTGRLAGSRYLPRKRTDKNGRVRFAGLTEGSYTVEIGESSKSLTTNAEVHVRAGANNEATVRLPRSVAYEGVVLSGGRPAPGASLTLRGTQKKENMGASFRSQTHTDDHGRFVFAAAPASHELELRVSLARGIEAEFRGNVSQLPPVVELPASGSLSVHVTVDAWPESRRFVAELRFSPDDGLPVRLRPRLTHDPAPNATQYSLRVDRVPVGDGQLQVSIEGYMDSPWTPVRVAADAEAQTSVALQALPAPVSATVEVVDGSGAPVAGASVYLFHRGPFREAQHPAPAPTDAEGRTRVFYWAEGHPRVGAKMGAAHAVSVSLIDLLESGVARLTMLRSGTLEIRVVERDGTVAKGCGVRIYDSDELRDYGVTTTLSVDESFRFRDVHAGPVSYEVRAAWGQLTGVIDLADGEDRRLDLEVPPRHIIRGTVIRNGSPVRGRSRCQLRMPAVG
ncbi:MAG: carboxypeptidase-like regulatory domain-containing protein [Planctomycetota bacterium]